MDSVCSILFCALLARAAYLADSFLRYSARVSMILRNLPITQPDSIPDDLRRFEAKIGGPLWLDVIGALPKTLAEQLAASVKSSEPSKSAIKQHIANGGVVEGASVKRGYHLRIE